MISALRQKSPLPSHFWNVTFWAERGTTASGFTGPENQTLPYRFKDGCTYFGPYPEEVIPFIDRHMA